MSIGEGDSEGRLEGLPCKRNEHVCRNIIFESHPGPERCHNIVGPKMLAQNPVSAVLNCVRGRDPLLILQYFAPPR